MSDYLDPTRTSVNFGLSGVNNETITVLDADITSISVSSFFKTTGKFYYEFFCTDVNNYESYGVAKSTASVDQRTGFDDHSWGFFKYGGVIRKYHNNSYTDTEFSAPVSGDTIMLAIDIDSGKIWFGVNGTWLEGNPAAGTGASFADPDITANGVSPAIHLRYAGSYGTLRLDATEFNYPPPSGFSGWSGSSAAVITNGVQHVWNVLADIVAGGIEHRWDVLQSLGGGIEHVWRQIVAGGIEHRWHMVPVVQGGIDHRWGNLAVLAGGIRHSWHTLKIFRGGIEHNWLTYQVLQGGVEHVFGVLGAVYQGGIEHRWDVKNTATIQGGVQHVWVGGGVGVDQEFAVSCTFGGGELRPHEIRRRRSRSEAGVEVRLEMAGEPVGLAGAELPYDLYRYSATDRAAAIAAARVEIDINGTLSRYLATEIPDSVSLDSGYTVVAESDLVLLDGPYAENVFVVDAQGNKSYSVEFGPGNVADIAILLAANYGFTLLWQAVNWWIPGGVLYANNEPPLDVLRKITDAVGAMIQPGATANEIVVKPFYPVPVSQWATAVPDEYLSYGGNFFGVTTAPVVRPGYNLYEVSDQLSVSDSLRFEEKDVRRGLKEIMAYEVPWTGVLPPLQTSGGDWVVIEAGQIVEEDVKDEEVQLIQGTGRTQKPIYAMVSRDYGPNRQLGAISYGEDGTIKTEIAGQSLCLVTYRTRYWRWLVADPKDERVQLYVLPAWADMPITLVVTFGDVAATNGFVVAEADDTRNVDSAGNVLSELNPGDPYNFQIQHDDTIRIGSMICSDGALSGGGVVSRAKEQQLQFADGSSVELPYIPTGNVDVDWYGRSPTIEQTGRKLKPGAWPAIGEASYGARMLSYKLTPPPLNLSGEEKHYILIVVEMVSV